VATTTHSASGYAAAASVVKVRSRRSSLRKRWMSRSSSGDRRAFSSAIRASSISQQVTLCCWASSVDMAKPTYPAPTTTIRIVVALPGLLAAPGAAGRRHLVRALPAFRRNEAARGARGGGPVTAR
jgi:hypothetical protein